MKFPFLPGEGGKQEWIFFFFFFLFLWVALEFIYTHSKEGVERAYHAVKATVGA